MTLRQLAKLSRVDWKIIWSIFYIFPFHPKSSHLYLEILIRICCYFLKFQIHEKIQQPKRSVIYFVDTTDNPTYFKFWTWREKFCSFVVMNLSTAYIKWYYICIFRMLFLSLIMSNECNFWNASFFCNDKCHENPLLLLLLLLDCKNSW